MDHRIGPVLRGLIIMAAFASALPTRLHAETIPGGDMQSLLDEYRLVDRVVRLIQSEYVRPVDRDELWRGAIGGMVQALDPHSRYLAQADLVRRSTDATDGGFGFSWQFDPEWGAIRVVRIHPESPAAQAGMVRGDTIIAVDDRPLDGLTPRQSRVVMERLDDGVTLRLRRADGTPLTAALQRRALDTNGVVEATMLSPRHGIGLVRLARFVELPRVENQTPSSHTASATLAAIQGLANNGLRGLILDLRGNPGGSLHAAVEIADLFLDPVPGEGTLIVAQTGRSPAHQARHIATTVTTLPDWPLVVIVDEATASAAEVVAAALRDHRRAVVVGTATRGKGSIQQRFLVGQQGALSLTVASYRTPNGNDLSQNGLQPDIEIPLSDRTRLDLIRIAMDLPTPEGQTPPDLELEDPQLSRARDILIGALLMGQTPGIR